MTKPIATRAERILLNNLVERVINTSVRIIERAQHEDAMMNIEDWETCKSIVVQLWNEARDRAFIRLNTDDEAKPLQSVEDTAAKITR